MRSSDITAIDNYCGAGGSTTGLKAAGIRVLHAANHWDRAIETHNTNHPEVDHSCVDLNVAHPGWFPRTTIGWFSIECFPKGTLILSKKGLIPIEDIRIGDQVLTHKNRWMPVTDTMKTVKDTVVLDGRWNPNLETTAEHPFWVRQRLRRDKINQGKERPLFTDAEWKPAAELNPGKQVWNRKYWATPILRESMPIPLVQEIKFDEAFWWIVGRWLGDGSLDIRPNTSIITICCGHHEADELEKMLQFEGLKWKRRKVRTATLFDVVHQPLALWLLEHFGKLAHGKTVPIWAWTMPDSWRENLLEGYVSADGYRKNDTFGGCISISTVSKKLSIGIRFLAESLGYPVSVRKYEQHCAVIEGRQLNVRPVYVIKWRLVPSKQHCRAYRFDDDHSWGVIHAVKPGRQSVEVFNLSVAEDESYVADGIVVHNCTSHSPAGGRKRKNQNQMHLWERKAPDPSVERSRMGAWDVVRFTEYHRYEVTIVENVLEFLEWELCDVWLEAMHKLGYAHQVVYFNSMFAYPNPVPQSRDRIYIVFHKKGNRKPNLDFRPPGICPEHGLVNCVQVWKNPLKRSGKYGKRNQYLYHCPKCGTEVVPFQRPARDAIDWSLPCPKIKDRKKPLSEATLRRIERGLKRFLAPHLIHTGHWGDDQQEFTVAIPSFIAPGRTDNMPTGIDEPTLTLTASNQQWLVRPESFFVHRGYSTSEEYDRTLSVDEPAPTQTTSAKLYLAQPFIDTARTHNVATGIDEPTPTVTTGRNLSVIQPPPFLGVYHGGNDRVHSVEEPSPTVATCKQFGLVQPEPFISSYYGTGGEAQVGDPHPTVRTVQGHALIQPDWSALVEECGYRMINADEAKLLMGFPADYIILGNQEERFKQEGNAVTPCTAEMIGRAVMESLSS